MIIKRMFLTPAEKTALVEKQNGLCSWCDQPLGLGGPTEFDHTIPVALGNDKKPDCAMHAACHLIKTARFDAKRIAKAKRQQRKSPRLHRTLGEVKDQPKRKIQSRGFDKRWSRRMDGKTIPRPTPNARAEV